MRKFSFFVMPVFEAADDAGGTGGADDDGGGGGDVQTLSFDWSGLSDENKVYAGNKKITHESDFNSILDMSRNTEAKIGKFNMAGPVEGKEGEFWADNAEAFGVGATPQDYKIDYGELPKGMETDEKMLSFLENSAHKMSMPKVFVDGLVNGFKGMRVEQHEALEAETAATEKAFVDELNVKFGAEAPAKKALAVAGSKILGLSESDLAMIEKASGEKYKVLNAVIRLGELDAEGKFYGGDGSGGGSDDTGEDFDQWRKDNDAILSDPKHKKYQATLAEYHRLLKLDDKNK